MDKAGWRLRLLGVRRELAAGELATAGAGLAEVAQGTELIRSARCVAAYLALSPEPDTGPLLSWLANRGTRVLLPVLHDDNDLGWGEAGSGLASGRFGLTQPRTDLGVDAIRAADVVLCPALAVDRRGVRLGRGGGSYDRALARVAAEVPVMAIVYDDELVDELPSDHHDRPVGFALTPCRLVALTGLPPAAAPE